MAFDSRLTILGNSFRDIDGSTWSDAGRFRIGASLPSEAVVSTSFETNERAATFAYRSHALSCCPCGQDHSGDLLAHKISLAGSPPEIWLGAQPAGLQSAAGGGVEFATLNYPGEVASTTGTSANISAGDTAFSQIDFVGDADWFSIQLQAGVYYQFSAIGTGASPLEDPILRLMDASGAQIAVDDDSGPGLNSLLGFTASVSGTYYLNVQSFPNTSPDSVLVGSYQLSVSTPPPPPPPPPPGVTPTYTIDQIADYLVYEGNAGGARWQNTTITYNIADLTPAERDLAVRALQMWAAVTPLNFVQTTGSANLTFVNAVVDDPGHNPADAGDEAAYARTRYSGGSSITSSTIVITSGWSPDTGGTTFDSYRQQTYIHEIGHALGLGHAGPYDGEATYGESNIYTNDNWAYTVMSYFDQLEAGHGNYRYVLGLQQADIAAIQLLYGLNPAGTYAGNTTFGFNSSAPGTNIDWAQFVLVQAEGTYRRPPAMTLYDTSGVDTINLSGFSQPQIVDLRPGTFSSLGDRPDAATPHYVNVVAIAANTIIENVVGGAGNDRITGNTANNTITLGGGADTFVYAASGGADTLTDFAVAVDRIDLTAFSSSAALAAFNSRTASGAGTLLTFSAGQTILLQGVTVGQLTQSNLILSASPPPPPPPPPPPVGVNLVGSAGNDTLSGGVGNDQIQGLGGADFLYGLDGDDTIFGGDGDDWLIGGAGVDLLQGGNQNDILQGEAGSDTLRGDAGNDQLYGGAGNDTLDGLGDNDLLFGEANDDFLYGRDGNDQLFGGDGSDWLIGGDGTDLLQGGNDNDILQGEAGDDTLRGEAGSDQLYGGLGNDTLDGGLGNDLLFSELGNDFLYGREGDDQLFGADGADWLIGGDGADLLQGGNDNDILQGELGDDTLRGEAANDQLYGGAGNDTLDGGLGDDFLSGEADNDFLYGREGNDQLYGNDGADWLIAGDGGDLLLGGIGNDILQGEIGNDILRGEAGDDQLYGGADSDTLEGGTENDKVFGEVGDDFLYGQDGTDELFGGDGLDWLFGGAGADLLQGGIGNDIQLGEDGNDIVRGEDGNDQLYGGLGDDTIEGGTGDDYLSGDDGDDFLYGQIGVDQLFGGNGADWLIGGDGNDLLMGGNENDILQGESGDDLMRGEAGNDQLYGGDGSDTLDGGIGADFIDGGAGSDVHYGGSGADTFAIAPSIAGTIDRIVDFVQGEDVIRLVSSGFASFAQVQAAMTVSGANTIITFGTGAQLRIDDKTPGQFTSADFALFSAAEVQDPAAGSKGTMYMYEPGAVSDEGALESLPVSYGNSAPDAFDFGFLSTTSLLNSEFDVRYATESQRGSDLSDQSFSFNGHEPAFDFDLNIGRMAESEDVAQASAWNNLA